MALSLTGNGSRTNSSVFTHFVLYRFVTKCDKSDEHQLADCSDDETALNILLTDVNPDVEAAVRRNISGRAVKMIQQNRSGNICAVDLPSHDSNSPEIAHLCYCSIIQTTDVTSQLEQTTDNSAAYVVALLTKADFNLDFLRTDLDHYIVQLNKLFNHDPLPMEKIKTSLSQWLKESTNYLYRCLSLFSTDIKYLLFMSMIGSQLKIKTTDSEIRDNIHRFLECCSLANAVGNSYNIDSSLNPSSDTDSSRDLSPSRLSESSLFVDCGSSVVTLALHDDAAYEFSSKDSDQFCDDYARLLMKCNQTDPVVMHQVIEGCKLKVIHDMNTLKRLLREAESDYYALYRCYVFLRSSGNVPILLKHAEREHRMLNSWDVLDILKLLWEELQ